MLTNKQKKLLENHIYNVLKESMFESDKAKKNNTNAIKHPDSEMRKFFNDHPEIKQSTFAYKMHPEMDPDEARGYFSKELRHAKNDNGSEYGFDRDEVHKFNVIANNLTDEH